MLELIFGQPEELNRVLYASICDAARRGETGQILIVPQHASHESERALCHYGGDSIALSCEVLTLRRLANRVFGEVGGLAERVLGDGERLIVMSLAARQVAPMLGGLARYIGRPEFLGETLRLWDELRSHALTPDRMREAAEWCEGELSDKLRDLALLFGAYEAQLGQSMSDPADLLTRLHRRLEDSAYAAGGRVYISGFTEFTPQELAVVDLLMRRAGRMTVLLSCGEESDTDGGPEDDPFYGQRLSAARLRRMAEKSGVPVEERSIPPRYEGVSEEMRFLRARLDGTDATRYPGRCTRVELHEERSLWEECEGAAAEVKRLCREEQMRLRDIVIAASDYALYAEPLEAVFRAWDIPLFSDRKEDVSRKPVVAALMAALDMMLEGFERHDVLRYLKTGLSPLGFDECCALENYTYVWNIRGRAQFGAEWTMHPDGLSAEMDERAAARLARLNELRRRVTEPFLSCLGQVGRGEHPARRHAAALYDLLVETGFDRAVERKRRAFAAAGERKLMEEYAQLWALVCEALDSMAELLGDTPMALREFAELFQLLLGQLEVGTIPVALDRVTAGDAGRLRHRSARAVIILGGQSGAFPMAAEESGILSDENRAELVELGFSLEPPAARRMYRQLDCAHSVLTLATERLYISWPCAADGSPRLPAVQIERVAELFDLPVVRAADPLRMLSAERPCLEHALTHLRDDAPGPASAALELLGEREDARVLIDRARRAARVDRGQLSAQAVRQLYGDAPALTASRADRFRSCHFAYFMEYGLRAKPRRRAEMDAMESGNFLHYILEHAVAEIMRRGGVHMVPEEALPALSDEIADRYAKEALGGLQDKGARVGFLFARLKRMARRVLENVAEELRVSKFQPMETELAFGEDGAEALRGKVDRVDGWLNGDTLYLRVVDYKSGVKRFQLSDIWHGLGMQMLIYLFALEQSGLRDAARTVGAGVLYLPVREAVYAGRRGLSDEQVRKQVDKELRRDGLVLGVPDVLDAMEEGEPKRFLPVGLRRSDAEKGVADLAQFGLLRRHVQETLRQIGRELEAGRITADPYYRDLQTSACTYCDYQQACHFDETNGADRRRYLTPLKPAEVWERMEEKGYGGSSNG